MGTVKARTFVDSPAVRSPTPLLLGLVGPSGCGKTYSALRLATGIRRVTGGDIFFIDTEAERGLHYCDDFKRPDGSPGFRHIRFEAPFGSLDYLAAIEHCAHKGAKVIVLDSMSHEHDGPGGILEQHRDALAGGKKDPSAWIDLKAERRRLINAILQLRLACLFCFRAKKGMHWPTKEEKAKGEKEPTPKGWEPIAGDGFIYEMTAKFLLYPGADGKPAWDPKFDEEREMVKRPRQFRELFAKHTQLDEELGEAMARWAAGSAAGPAKPIDAGALVERYEACSGAETLAQLEAERVDAWEKLPKADKARVKAAAEAAKARVAASSAAEAPSDQPSAADPFDPPALAAAAQETSP